MKTLSAFQVRPQFFSLFTAFVYIGIIIVHGVRIYFGFDIYYADVFIPIWVSALICILMALLALASIRQLK